MTHQPEPGGSRADRRTDPWTGRVDYQSVNPQLTPPSWPRNDNDSLPPLADPRPSPARVRSRHVEWVLQRLSARDWRIIHTVHQFRLITGHQVGRLHFADLRPSSRDRIRRRVLARLVTWRVLTTLDRRIGGHRAGSTGLIYTLDTAGHWLIRLAAAHHGTTAPRRPTQPGPAFTNHTLVITQLHVDLVERSRTGQFDVRVFQAEPACWWPDGHGGLLKPDAHTILATGSYQDAWWIEADLGTEPLTRLRAKLRTYVDFVHHGGTGPTAIIPRILITTPTPARTQAIHRLITGLPPPADQLFAVCPQQTAADHLTNTLLTK